MNRLKKILIATHNPGKIAEFKRGLKKLSDRGIKIVTLKDVGVEDKPEETGKTFKENALIKAKFYSQKTGLPALADDGGLVIPYLKGEPGVKSARWLGREATDQELITNTLIRLKNAKNKQRKAYLELFICFYDPDKNKQIFANTKINGHIANRPNHVVIKGFPYRALLIIDNYNRYYDDLTENEHKTVNHRLLALKKIVKNINIYL